MNLLSNIGFSLVNRFFNVGASPDGHFLSSPQQGIENRNLDNPPDAYFLNSTHQKLDDQNVDNSPDTHFLNTMQQGIDAQDNSVIGPILLYCKRVQGRDEAAKACGFLFQVLPRFNEQQLIDFLDPNKSCLPVLLRHTSPQQQQTLSLQLAQWFSAHSHPQTLFPSSLQAMHYFAKTIQIAQSQGSLGNIHQLASQPFMHIIRQLLIQEGAFQKMLLSLTKVSQDDHWAFTRFETHIAQIALLKRFCCEEIDHQTITTLYRQAADVLRGVHERYDTCSDQVLRGLNEPCSLPEKPATERYWEALSAFRSCFPVKGDVRDFQSEATEAFRKFFKVLIDDAFAINGPPPAFFSKMKYTPPCRYDIRAMGSLGREEVCPDSDLEFFILIENEAAIPFFKNLVHILEIQIASLGETSTGNPVFTCIHTKNPSGLHIDSSPTLNAKLIQTPSNMAQLQYNPVNDPQTVENTILKSISLHQSDPQLFEDYKRALQEPLDACREKRACALFAAEAKDYQERWKHPFNPQADNIDIKLQYVKTLNYLLSDMALFCGIEKTNTLDIVDALVAQKIFTPESGLLLKESVAAIYTIRTRLHIHYKQQKEVASCVPHLSFATLTSKEISALEKCYWLVLQPLYAHLKSVVDPLAPKDFKTVFHNVNLIDIAFKEHLTAHPEPLISQIASHLCSIQAPLDVHVNYFKTLSIGPASLRDRYLNIVEESNLSTLLQTLLQIPNRAGLRPVFFRNFHKLEMKLHEITEPFSSQVVGGTEVMISAPHFQKPRFLQPCFIEQIMEGENIRSLPVYGDSAHRVNFIHNLHLKQKPSNPLMEYAIHSLTSRIAGQLTPATTLLRFDVSSKGKKKSYPVLLSQTIPGKNLKDAWREVRLNSNFTWTLLCSILTRPGDGRLSNYILADEHLYCIDNDLSFVEPVVSSFLSRTVHFCSVPFCLFPLDTPLDPGALQEFLALDSHAIFDGWVKDLIQREQEYMQLFSKEERAALYEEDPKNAFTPTILFRKGTLATLHLQFWRMQQAISLSLQKGKSMTIGDLLKELVSLREESIGTYVYKAYHNSLPSPEKKLQKATSRVQERSMTSIQYHEACLGKIPSIEEIEHTKIFSIEEARKEFLFSLLERNSLYATVKTNTSGMSIQANFQDLNKDLSRQALVLQALTDRVIMSSNKLRSLTLHHSNLLTEDLLDPLLSEGLEVLDLRYCAKIENSALRLIEKKCPHLKQLHLAGCTGLTEIAGSFFEPFLEFPKLEYCDVSHCTQLRELQIKAPSLQTLQYNHSALLLSEMEMGPTFWRTLPVNDGRFLTQVNQDISTLLSYLNDLFPGTQHSEETDINPAIFKESKYTSKQITRGESDAEEGAVPIKQRYGFIEPLIIPRYKKDPSPLPNTFISFQIQQLNVQAKENWGSDQVNDRAARSLALASSGESHRQQGKYREGANDLYKALEINPRNLVALVSRGALDCQEGKWDDAIKTLNKALEIDPRNWIALASRGVCTCQKGLYQEAIEDLNQALEADPKSLMALVTRGICNLELAKPKEAMQDINKALEIDPKNLFALEARGSCNLEQRKYLEAMQDFNQVLEIDPGYAFSLENHRESRLLERKYQEAMLNLNTAVVTNPKNSTVLTARGLCNFTHGRLLEALQDFNQALEIDPKEKFALASRIECNRNIKSNEQLIQTGNRMMESTPRRSAAFQMGLINRGYGYFTLGKFQEAMQDCNQAMTVDFFLPTAFMIRGQCNHKQGKYEEAMQDFNRALELGKNVLAYKEACQKDAADK